MKLLYSVLTIILLWTLVLGNEELQKEGELKREKKDISKLQALFGLNKGKQIPVVNLHEWKRPLYYVPPCNCWRPATRYGVPADDSSVVYQPARPSVVLPAEPAIKSQPELAIPAQPAVRTQPEPGVVIPAQPAIRTVPPPSLVIPAQPAFPSPPQLSYVISAEPARYSPPAPPRFYPSNPNPQEPCVQRDAPDGYHYDRPQAPLNH